MRLRVAQMQQLPTRHAELGIYATLPDDSVAASIANVWNELVAEGSESRIPKDSIAPTRLEVLEAGPFSLTVDPYQAIFLQKTCRGITVLLRIMNICFGMKSLVTLSRH